jgi:hypothetical protein
MAPLEGIAIEPGRHVELLPVSGRAEHVAPTTAGDPWNDGSRFFGGAGLDLRYGVGTGMALVGAINPDFGQVEVDPAVVNLTAFETFYEEKRPFFTEGSQVFLRFGRSGASEYTTHYYPESSCSIHGASAGRRRARPSASTRTCRPRRPSWARPSWSAAPQAAGTSVSWRP